jgi:hypothetical protein
MPDAHIVGAQRSGTTWLQRLLGAHPAIAAPQETFLFHRYLGPMTRAWRRERQMLDRVAEGRSSPTTGVGREIDEASSWRLIGLPTVLTDEQFTGWCRSLVELVRAEVLAGKPGATAMVEKSPEHSFEIETIAALLPDTRFVHVVRDPVDAVASHRAAPWRRSDPAPIDQFAERWESYVSSARRLSAWADHFLEVRYEDLARRPADVLAEVLHFVGVDASDAATLVATVAAERGDRPGGLVISGEARRLGLRDTEPDGFDRRSRDEPAPLDAYERWVVHHHAPTAEVLGYHRSFGPAERLRFTVRHAAERAQRRVAPVPAQTWRATSRAASAARPARPTR